MTAIIWFNQDLRISDNPALTEACKHQQILPIYILSPQQQLGEAKKIWLHHSLRSFNKKFANKLNFYIGDPQQIISKLAKKYQISQLCYNQVIEPSAVQIQLPQKIFCSQDASLLWKPWQIVNKKQEYYKVFTHFYKLGCLAGDIPRSTLPPPQLPSILKDDDSLELEQLNLLPQHSWHLQLMQNWQVGEESAWQKLITFSKNGLAEYKTNRNIPSLSSYTSQLSPHLNFGEISPHQIWHFVKQNNDNDENLQCFLSELGWREFSYYLLYHFPQLQKQNFQTKFNNFPWQNNLELLQKWQQGKTGIPIVDAGMRQLWQTGYMHNRLRMIVGSFLVKNLLIDWRLGEQWFFNCLLDANIASNSASWQWVAGSGADAAPYFRIFNPILQSEKFDNDGNFIRKFVPELSRLKNVFAPWQQDRLTLKMAGIELGKNYPQPIVDLESSRKQALEIFSRLS